MVSAFLTWNGATKQFFVDGCGVKIMQTYKRHLQKEILPAVQRLYIYKSWIFVYKSMYHHTVQTPEKIFYKNYSIHILSKHMNDLLHQMIAIVLIIFFLNKVEEKVYKNRLNKPFENERELKKRIESVSKYITFSLPEIQRAIKQFAGRLKAVK